VKSRKRVIPAGVRINPAAERYLESALATLRQGLPVSALAWTERARRELDALIGGERENAISE